jgi:hypothetical protein
MKELSSVKGWHFVRFGFRPGIQATLHLRNFNSPSDGAEFRRLATLTFARSEKISFKGVTHSSAVLRDAHRHPSGMLWKFKLVFHSGEIEVEAEDVSCVLY